MSYRHTYTDDMGHKKGGDLGIEFFQGTKVEAMEAISEKHGPRFQVYLHFGDIVASDSFGQVHRYTPV